MDARPLIEISFVEVAGAKDVDFMASWIQLRDTWRQADDYLNDTLYRSLVPDARFRFVSIVHYRSTTESRGALSPFESRDVGVSYRRHGGLYRVEREDRVEGDHEHPGHIALIDPFHVAPETDPMFLAGWEPARLAFRDQPGYLAAALHRSLGPTVDYRFVNVALWTVPDAYEKALQHPGFRSTTNMLRSHVRFASYPALYEPILG
jgi:hypothetical protein